MPDKTIDVEAAVRERYSAGAEAPRELIPLAEASEFSSNGDMLVRDPRETKGADYVTTEASASARGPAPTNGSGCC